MALGKALRPVNGPAQPELVGVERRALAGRGGAGLSGGPIDDAGEFRLASGGAVEAVEERREWLAPAGVDALGIERIEIPDDGVGKVQVPCHGLVRFESACWARPVRLWGERV